MANIRENQSDHIITIPNLSKQIADATLRTCCMFLMPNFDKNRDIDPWQYRIFSNAIENTLNKYFMEQLQERHIDFPIDRAVVFFTVTNKNKLLQQQEAIGLFSGVLTQIYLALMEVDGEMLPIQRGIVSFDQNNRLVINQIVEPSSNSYGYATNLNIKPDMEGFSEESYQQSLYNITKLRLDRFMGSYIKMDKFEAAKKRELITPRKGKPDDHVRHIDRIQKPKERYR